MQSIRALFTLKLGTSKTSLCLDMRSPCLLTSCFHHQRDPSSPCQWNMFRTLGLCWKMYTTMSVNACSKWQKCRKGSVISEVVQPILIPGSWQVQVFCTAPWLINTLRQRQIRCHFTDDVWKCIFSNQNVWILIKISLKFVRKGPIDNILALVQIMACCLFGANADPFLWGMYAALGGDRVKTIPLYQCAEMGQRYQKFF